MLKKQTLQRRIIIAFFLLTTVLCGGFAVVTYFVIHELETKLFYEHLQQDAEWLISASKKGTLPDLPPGIHLYRANRDNATALPDYLQTLKSDKAEVVLEDRAYHVIVQHEGDTSYYLVQDQSHFEETEIAFGVGILLAFISALAGALWLGSTTADRVIDPVIRLASQVRDMDNGESGKPIITDQFSDDEVGQLASAFRQYTRRLHDFLNREQLFTGDVSHELRTPLTAITGACELLLPDPTLDTKQLQKIERIYRASQEMRFLVDTFLMLSREHENASGQMEPFQINSIIIEEIENLQHESDNPVDIEFNGNTVLEIQGIPQLFRVVIRNLLRNALHYTRKGTVTVTVNQDTVEVEDTGSGIPGALRDSIFDRHVQGADKNDSAQGQGLGLSIVKRICTYHDWSIRFAPVTPTGSRFMLDLSQNRHPSAAV